MKKIIKCLCITVVIFLIPCVLIYLNHAFFFQSFTSSFEKIFLNFIPFVFECLIFSAFAAILFALTNRVWISALIVQICCLVFTVISQIKQSITGAPVLLTDFEFINNLDEITGYASSSIRISKFSIIIIGLNVVVFAALFFLERKVKNTKWITRLICLVCGLTAAVLFFTPAVFRYNHQISQKYASEEEKILNYGAVNGLYFTYASVSVADYTLEEKEIIALKKEVRNAVAGYTYNEETPVTPNVIFIMSEGFFDITCLPDVTYSADPCPNFRSLQETSTSGKFISPRFSGGTGLVEAELLTGISSTTLKNGETLTDLSSNKLYKRMPVITDVFKNYGYETTFLHSHNNALYNRVNMYKGFGFDNILFDDSFPEDAERYGTLISDSELTKKIISILEAKPDTPKFVFAVSMENHYPYYNGKYSPSARIDVESEKLSDKELEMLNCLADGINGADAALGELIDYINKQDEPYMVVFFGDHRPNLTVTDDVSVYTTLGVSSSNSMWSWRGEEFREMYETDYVIWTNYEEENTYPDKDEGCTFFGLNVLKRLGFNLTDYYIYLDSVVAKNTLFYKPGMYITKDGKCFEDVPESERAAIDSYNVAIKDIIYSDNKVFGINR